MSDTPPPTTLDETIASTGTPAPVHAEDRLEVGEVIAERYCIEARIGEGGMGSVYRATHMTMGHHVALKVLHKELARDPEFTQRFRREAQAASAIKHPNICGATDFGTLPNGAPYMVMEHLDGETLEDLMQREVLLPVKDVLHIASQVLSVLQEAHAHGIVHRDLKPENIMLVTRAGIAGFVKVMDFGIASIQDGQRLSPETRITRAGIAYGTPAYMSPEQVSGEPVIDGRADLYSLGIMMFEMLTGTPPFQGNNVAAIMAQHLTTQAPSLRTRTPSAKIPEALDAIVLRLLEKDPAARFATASELGAALTVLTAVATPPPADASHSQHLIAAEPQVSNKRLLLLAIPLVGLLLVAIVVVLAVALTQPPPVEKPIEVTASSPPEVIKQSIEVSRRQFVTQTPGLNDLIVLMAAGQQKEAVTTLEARAEELQDSPHYHYYLALAHEGSDAPDKASPHYLQAIKDDERYLQDALVIAHFSQLATSNKAELRALFATAAAEVPAILEPVVKEAVVVAINPDTQKKQRARAIELLTEHQHLEKLPEWQRALISLEDESKCDARVKAIDQLAMVHNPDTHAALVRWDKKPRSGCSGKTFLSKINKDQDCYACVRSAIAKALKAHASKTP